MKKYIRCNSSLPAIPVEAQKYYKRETHPAESAEDLEELADEFAYYGLKFLYTVEAKSRYADIFEIADMRYASVCQRKDGSIGVFVLASATDYPVDLTEYPDKIEDIIDRVERHN